MAPRNVPSSRKALPTKSILKKTTHQSPSNSESSSLFPPSKKDKRLIKHAQLMNKVAKASAKKPRRRRPNKKLVTTLDSLADALPDSGEQVPNSRAQDQVNIIQRKSMKSKPGAMKRREKLDKSERDRFAKNMAQLAGSNGSDATHGGDLPTGTPTATSTTSRWAALRGFISQTLETRPDLQTAKS
ncbi:hypothetical protein PV10_03069 [Exophiala mesophila]|uniref:Ribosome biogenesis protein SLX9 n=1 Tax=Exophiala mesophila TaxID=212818 RepID=A0A0D1ZN77_EXOME|nr:uncharacterized protein PV10_03069 [Exophiala mesophila]KIV95409.1 hypothetical protein PV10_03069 [Exophiala mesophila]